MKRGIKLDFGIIEKIFNQTLSTMETSKEEIFSITENIRGDYHFLEKELTEIKKELSTVINSVDKITKINNQRKKKLIEINKQFDEKGMLEAYKQASEAQSELQLLQAKEIQLNSRRNEIERALRSMKTMIEKAENLLTQMNMAVTLLQGGLAQSRSTAQEEKENNAFLLVKSQEEERTRLAREIHDGPAQSFTHIVLRLEIMERLLNSDTETVRLEIASLKKQVRLNLQEIRRIVFNLRPIDLDEAGIGATLSKYIEKFQHNYGIHCVHEIRGKEQNIDKMLEITLFRLIQEGMTNVAKHAQATLVSIKLQFFSNSVIIEIEDNGIGFNFAEMEEKIQGKFGLLGMQERIEMLSGQFIIKSIPNEGTKIRICIPIRSKLLIS